MIEKCNVVRTTTDYCSDRKVADSRGRFICGHTLQDGDKVVIIDDLITTGLTMCERIDRLKEIADIDVVAIVVIANLANEEAIEKGYGPKIIEDKYSAKVYSIITDKDIENAN